MPNYGQYGENSTWKGRFNYKQINFLKRNFDKSDGYCTVTWYKSDFTEVEDIPVHIFNSTLDIKKGIKKFACHPDYPFNQGDVIDYIDGYKYLVTSKDEHESVQAFGKITRTHESISWKDGNGNIKTYHYASESSGIGGQDTNIQVPLSNSKKVLWLQRNSDTLTIYENQRFILWNRQPYKCTFIDLEEIGIVKITLELDQINPLDDLNNNIAYNGEVVNTPDLDNGVIFSKESLTITKYTTQSVDVYNYVASVADGTTFTFRIDGIDSSKYTIISTTGNSISVQCNSGYYEGTLVAITDIALDETSIPLILKNL